MSTSSNETVPVTEVLEHLRNWNFSWNIILTVFIAVLQYGNMKYSFFLYGVKMLIMWLLWPLVIALSIFNAYADFGVNWWFFSFSILMLVITLVLWLMYIINSFKLYRRTRTFWAFNPETDAIAVISVFGRSYSIPMPVAPTGITLTILSGTLFFDGIRIATGVQPAHLPQFVTVAKPGTTIIYTRAGRSLNASTNTGWAFYVRSKHGDYSALSNSSDNLTENDRLLHLV
uniref:Membrane protein n=1 Tax=Rhinolophus bat coronavirus HKU2 TaxID=693998 RepID=A8JP03_9ALPC|nr:membrane glycoprotein [Rhinolophus bat coronavirus HKU2]ABQ57227.1 membrane glycoprotein [Rhinolophus bat coronavirus HKU2]ABQ57235.1 membrane glycoprotein [Rhinolophus bat coronavirus HKU2]AVM80503.1 membrane glycoprotein [Swine acute diarrhea syndrome related coronavirus]